MDASPEKPGADAYPCCKSAAQVASRVEESSRFVPRRTCRDTARASPFQIGGASAESPDAALRRAMAGCVQSRADSFWCWRAGKLRHSVSGEWKEHWDPSANVL